MISTILRHLYPPKFNNKEKNRPARVLHIILSAIFVVVLSLIFVFFLSNQGNLQRYLYFAMILGITAILFLLTRRGYIRLTTILLILFSWITNFVGGILFSSLNGLVITSFFITILLAGLLLGKYAAVVTAVSTFGAILILAFIETQGLISPETLYDTPFISLYGEFALLTIITFLLYLTLDDLNKANQEAREKGQALSNTINETPTALTSALDLEQVLDTILTLLYKVIPYDSVAIFLAEKNNLRVKAGRGFENPQDIIGQEFAYESGVFDEIARTLRPLVVPDAQADSRFVNWAENDYIRGWLGIPLIVNDELIGYLTIDSFEIGKYDALDAEIAQSFANQAAIAIENARLFERVQNQAANLENEVAKRTLDLNKTNRQLELEITERKKAEELLQEYTVELERSNQDLKSFAYIVSHDLQAPLRKIQAFGDRLSSLYNDALDDRGQDYIKRMQSAANRMSLLINDLLNYSRITTINDPFCQVDLNEVLNEVLLDLESQIENENGELQVSKLPVINGNATQMYQLFLNLISNSLKFHNPETPPEISIKADNISAEGKDWYRILIRDNGIGFEEKYLDRIFDIFQRLHSNDTYSGTGVGLATCRKIVTRHRGNITAQSQPDQGATFIITLPVT